MTAAPRTVLGFDYGTRRIGTAVGQTLTATAKPLTPIRVQPSGPDWDAVSRLIEQWQPQVLVVGLPSNMDGTPHEMTAQARRFGNRLHGRYNLPVCWIDERLSSVEAQHRLTQTSATGNSRPRKDKDLIHSVAAQVILETWFGQQATATDDADATDRNT